MDTHLLTLTERDEWRAWLAGNHASTGEVWLFYEKKEAESIRLLEQGRKLGLG